MNIRLNSMKRSVFFLTLIILGLFLIPGCDDYPEGPDFSFRSQEGRIINKWKPEYVVRNGDDISFQHDSTTWEFFSDNTLEISNTFMDSLYIQECLWDVIDDGATIRILYTDPPAWPDRSFMEIIRLKDKNLWLKDDMDSLVYEYRLIPVE